MEKLSKTSLNYVLSEYLNDLKRSGVQDFQRAPRVNTDRRVSSAASQQTPSPQPTRGRATISGESSVSRAVPSPTVSSSAIVGGSGDSRVAELRLIADQVAGCSRCAELVANRTQTVFGVGDPHAELVFIGEGPGAEEDLRGEPFVGRSGKLLTDMIEKGMRVPRSSVFICNIVRCRPPGNRNPTSEEAAACRPFLDATLKVVAPKYICCLGSIAATNLLGVQSSLGQLRGVVHSYGDAKVVCTYHPAYLLRNPSAKKDAWLDLQLLMTEMGLPRQG